jgi:hypothetical protein
LGPQWGPTRSRKGRQRACQREDPITTAQSLTKEQTLMTDSRLIVSLPSRRAPIAPPRPGELTMPTRPTHTAQQTKVSLTLNPVELAAILVEDGKRGVRLRIRLPDRKLITDIAAKSLR